MNNCDNTDGGSGSSIQTLQTTTVSLTSSSTTPPTTATASATTTANTTPTTALVDNNKQETFYITTTPALSSFSSLSTSNESLINNSTKGKQENRNDTECAGNTSDDIKEISAITAVTVTSTTAIEFSDSVREATAAAALSTTTTVTTAASSVSYAAITAMDTATATAVVTQQQQQQHQYGLPIGNDSLVATTINCDINSTIICDNELVVKQPSSTPPTPPPSPSFPLEQFEIQPNTVVPSTSDPIALMAAAIEIKSATAATSASMAGEANGDGLRLESVAEETLIPTSACVTTSTTSAEVSSSPLSTEENENKEKVLENNISKTTTPSSTSKASAAAAVAPPAQPEVVVVESKTAAASSSLTSPLQLLASSSPMPSSVPLLGCAISGSTDSNSVDITANGSKNNFVPISVATAPSSMLLRKKITNALTTTSSEPILTHCRDDNSNSGSGRENNVSSSSALTATTCSSSEVISRRVSFPKSDDALVTGYLEPANPWKYIISEKSIPEIAEHYLQSCQKHNTVPIQAMLDQLKTVELNKAVRQASLSLKSIPLSPAACEALEEVFKRVQYKSIDVSLCDLNETAASALFEMFEYYEATNELDISSNAEGMTSRGWASCTYMVAHSRELEVLNAQGNPLSRICADNLGNALNSSNLHTLKLEHCGLTGQPLDALCSKLRNNQILRELWLAHNDLTYKDADKIAHLLRTNHYLKFIDISNNNIQDDGLRTIVEALIYQSTELEQLQRAAAAAAAALAEAEHKRRQQQLLNSSTNNATNNSNGSSIAAAAANGSGTINDDDTTSGDSDASPAEEEEDDEDEDDDADDADVDTDANDAEDDDPTTTTDDGGGTKVTGNTNTTAIGTTTTTAASTAIVPVTTTADDDDEDEDTIKTTTMKTTPPINGQSKLDKLLSMNNSDSSEEVPTDTVAASDISVSDDIFDSTNGVHVVTSTPIVESAIEERPIPNDNNNTVETTVFEASDVTEGTIAETTTPDLPSKTLDMNKNATKLDDFDDTHSTDSAFESSSDGDISRHLPDEFASRFDGKDEVETATIATEALTTPTPTPTPTPPPVIEILTPPIVTAKPIEVTPSTHSLGMLAASVSPNTSCDSSAGDMSALKNAALTGTSPSPASGMRRTESTCTITQSTRVRSHSSDSLSSDNSLDGSIGDASSGNFSTKINEKLTKNDTLTRQKQFDVPQDSNKTPHGLKALALWNNNLTKESGPLIADLLATTVSLELLNIGKNILSNDFVDKIHDSLSQNTTLTTLGLQSAHLSCAGISKLASILQFGGNNTLQRIDIRDNKIEVESLNMLAEALKSNTTVTQIDIDDEPKRLSIGSDAQLDYARVLENVRSLCSRNENQPAQSAAADKASSAAPATKRRGGYYLGSRKISLTCHTAPPRPIIDQANNATPTSSKLEVKKKTGVRLRSPIPSPPTSSPSSSPVPSPSKSRFQVSLVAEVSPPLTSPMSPYPSPSPSPSPSPTPIYTVKDVTGVLINSKDSTATIKRLSTSPRSRFQVMKIYEDLRVPIEHRTLPPITPSPSPPTAPSITTTPSITTPPSLVQKPATKPVETKIVTTPATPPLDEKNDEAPTFPAPFAPTKTDTKTNPNPLIVNNSTNTVKPNDQVDTSDAPSPPPQNTTQDEVRREGDENCQPSSYPSLAVPPPVVDEDQRTLTNSSVNSCLIDSIAVTLTTASSSAQSASPDLTSSTQTLPSSSSILANQESQSQREQSQELQELQPQAVAARTRKTSWIANPPYSGPVERLLNMFQNPGQLFQRSSSPDTTTPMVRQEDRSSPSFEGDQQSLAPVRRRSPPAATQLTSWCKLSAEICKPVTTAIQTAAVVSSGQAATGSSTTAVVASTVEGPFSFLDAASKQLRDIGKQVFRQNVTFGNEATNVTSPTQGLPPQQLHHDCDTIPSDMKLEIKENISPEHTINEETLQTLQKIGGSPGGSSTSSNSSSSSSGSSGSNTSDTTEGASSISTASSPSSLLNAPLIGVPPTPTEVLGAAAVAAQSHVAATTEEQSCSS